MRLSSTSRMCARRSMLGLLASPRRSASARHQPHPEGRADAGRRLYPDVAAEELERALDGGEPDAGAGVDVFAVQPLEDAEDLVVELRGDADAVVADPHHHRVLPPLAVDPRSEERRVGKACCSRTVPCAVTATT